ncbi:MAG TPA: alpha/beta hydrolase family protein [Mycobacteriales bacterium]|nr:alpha/beta hydrolase family protein [Mycobacteriales bacterium]
MALLRCDFFSEALELSTSMTVILPQETTHQIGMTGKVSGGEPPVLYLLHGLSDDDTIWLRRTSIERYVAPLGMAVVMPQVQRSFYADEVNGNRYWQFISEELPTLVHKLFRVSDRPEDTYVAGLSMGGYGAFKLALRQPERFAAAASLSGALDIAAMHKRAGGEGVIPKVFGAGDITGGDDDLISLLERADRVPRLYLWCGTEDGLLETNRTFIDTAARKGIELKSELSPGDHSWGHWDEKIQDVLRWMLER